VSDVVPFPHEGWSAEDAERFLLARERFGMRFGLDRIHRLLNVLELGQIPFPSIEIVGTNGKSSTTRMLAAVLERHGLRTGCFTSPHLLSYRERIRVGEQDIVPERFAAQIARTVRAGELVDRSQQDAADRVTQFELLTAAALAEFAAAGVDVAVLEAGLGGRYDATNAVDSRVAVLTNVGLEHTRYLGPTIADIAREKLAVVRPGATLVIGAGLAQSARELAWRTAAERGVKLVRAVEDRRIAPSSPRAALTSGATSPPRAPPRARSSARAGPRGGARCGPQRDRAGRFEVHDGAPQVLFDGATTRWDRCAHGVAAGVRRRAAPCRRRLDPRRQGRRVDAPRTARPHRRARLHGHSQPARAACGDARVAGRPARRGRGAG